MESITRTHRGSLPGQDALHTAVQGWFTKRSLDAVLGRAGSETEKIARSWLLKAGKRWRPFLLAGTFGALRSNHGLRVPSDVRKLAVAVECFHKASLIHDDIEDEDLTRYGEKTLHAQYNVPVALNAGDLLVGEGYRLIGGIAALPRKRIEMLQAATGAHRDLCLGQGQELCWMHEPAPLSSHDVTAILRGKTAPAFRLALRLGAICAGAGADVSRALDRYSDSLGVAYQVRDDLDDFWSEESCDALARRPSLLMAIAYERAAPAARRKLEGIWRRQLPIDKAHAELRSALSSSEVRERAERKLLACRNEAIRALGRLRHKRLRLFLYMLTERILARG